MWLAFGTQTLELRDGEVVVGSGADADWRVATADLMPRHFTITVHGLNASLRPSSKDNVVVVNGRQLLAAPHLLNEGDVILAGGGSFVFSDDSPIVREPDVATSVAYLRDDSAGIAHELRSRSTSIGRDPSNAIVLRDASASRFHAEVRREAGGFALHSMGASGALLNGRPLGAPALLADGDVLELAYERFLFSTAAPTGMPLAGPHDPAGEPMQRNPTLATGKISVVARERAWGAGRIAATLMIVVAIALAAAYLAR